MMKKSLLPFILSSLFVGATITQAADYYVDPSTGSMANNGSENAPWSTLQAVFSSNKTFVGGDVIHLLTGNHGTPTVKGQNGSDVFIQAAEGNWPQVSQLTVNGGQRWVISGLTVSPEVAGTFSGGTLVSINSSSRYITLEHCRVYFAHSVEDWTVDEVLSRFGTGISCSAPDSIIRKNHVYNTNYSIELRASGNRTVISENFIEDIAGDAIRVLADDAVVEYNWMQNWYGLNTHHDDAIQSWSGGSGGVPVGTSVVRGVIIRGNVAIDATSDDRLFPVTYGVQGLGLFDGFFEDWVLENNVIITDMWHGITFLGARNCRIVNNTVVYGPYSSQGRVPWITVGNHKNGTASTGNIVRNNLATDMSTLVGTEASNNVEISAFSYNFVDYSHFDLHLLLGRANQAINLGTATDAATLDRDKNTRTAPIDIGAYESGSRDPLLPVSNAGADQVVGTADVAAGGTVHLDGSTSTAASGATITRYEWSVQGWKLGEGKTLAVNLPVGRYRIELTVTDGAERSSRDELSVMVKEMAVVETDRYIDWMGYIWADETLTKDTFAWVYHIHHAWIFLDGNTDTTLWFFDRKMGWMWASENSYPFIYSYQYGAWLYYYNESKNPRWFVNMSDPSRTPFTDAD
mgnify:CR=1 FL=1